MKILFPPFQRQRGEKLGSTFKVVFCFSLRLSDFAVKASDFAFVSDLLFASFVPLRLSGVFLFCFSFLLLIMGSGVKAPE